MCDILLLKTHRCGFMYGELTDKETVGRLEYTLENQQQDQFEILLYKKNSEYMRDAYDIRLDQEILYTWRKVLHKIMI